MYCGLGSFAQPEYLKSFRFQRGAPSRRRDLEHNAREFRSGLQRDKRRVPPAPGPTGRGRPVDLDRVIPGRQPAKRPGPVLPRRGPAPTGLQAQHDLVEAQVRIADDNEPGDCAAPSPGAPRGCRSRRDRRSSRQGERSGPTQAPRCRSPLPSARRGTLVRVGSTGRSRLRTSRRPVLTSGLFRRLVPELFRQQDGSVSRSNPLLPEERVPSGGGFGVYPKELCSSGLLVCVHNILISNHFDGNLM